MKEEVDSATKFLGDFVAKKLGSKFAECFKAEMSQLMTVRYRDHWHPQKPQRGSAFRSIAIHYDSIDPLVLEALTRVAGSEDEAKAFGRHFPQELTLWVDPMEVSYRIGDHGSIGVVFACPSPRRVNSSDSESDSSAASSANSSPCSSPFGSPPRPTYMGYRQQQQQQPLHFQHQQQHPVMPISHQCRQQMYHQSSYHHHNGLMVYS